MTIYELKSELKNKKAEHRKHKDVRKTIHEATELDRKVPMELRSKVQSLEKQLKEANDRVDITQEVESDLQGDMMMAEAETDGPKSHVRRLKAEKGPLATDVNRLQRLLADKDSKLKDEQDTSALERQEHKKTQDKVTTLQAALQQSQQETGSLQHQVHDAKSEVDRAESLQAELDRTSE
jgi:chromosome segregation ATPase